MPSFVPDGGAALVLARGFAVVFLLSVSGTLTFRNIVMPRVSTRVAPDCLAAIERGLIHWIRFSLILAALTLCAWLVVLTSYLAGPDTPGEWLNSPWAVLVSTSFGHILLLQFLLLILTGAVLGRRPGTTRWRVGLVLGTAAALAQVGHGHAYAMAKIVSFLELSEALHLWAAGAWLGSLLPLLLVVWIAPASVCVIAARWYSPLGKVCVVLLAASAFLQGWILVGSTRALVHTAYGWTALLKTALFAALVSFAILNRYWLAPGLIGKAPNRARTQLLTSLLFQTMFGLLIVLAAALLAQLRPGMDMAMQG